MVFDLTFFESSHNMHLHGNGYLVHFSRFIFLSSVEVLTGSLHSCKVENCSIVVSYIFGEKEDTILEKRGRLPWHQFVALLLWTDLVDMRNAFLCFLRSSGLRGCF